MEIVSLKNTKLGFGVMKSLGYEKDKVKLVVNRCNSSYGISRAEVEAAFKDSTIIMIPEDEKTVCTSVNKGQPFYDNAKNNKLKIVKAMKDMCNNLDI